MQLRPRPVHTNAFLKRCVFVENTTTIVFAAFSLSTLKRSNTLENVYNSHLSLCTSAASPQNKSGRGGGGCTQATVICACNKYDKAPFSLNVSILDSVFKCMRSLILA